MSNPNTRKSCVVPKCNNTTTNSPEKLFFIVPKDVKMRKKWIKVMKRLDPFGDKSTVYCCEDHFDIENDMEKYTKYMLVGGRIKLKQGIVPHKFKCQQEKEDKPQRSAVQKHDSPEAVEPKAAEPSPPPPALLCDECGLAFTGFIYECVQCGHRMCSACDHVGAHKDHYVLRIPADRPKSETDKMMSKVRAAIGVEKLSRPARDKDKARRVPQVSDSEPDEVADGTSEAEDTAMTVKMEVEVEEFDSLQAPALAADDARVNEVEVTIKSEPPDEESYSDPKCNSADPCNVSSTMPTATTTIKREVDESEPGSSQQKKKRQKKGKADT